MPPAGIDQVGLTKIGGRVTRERAGNRRNRTLIALLVAAVVLAPVGLYAVRRLIHHFQPRPLLMAGQDHSVSPMPDAYKMSNPLDPAIHDARQALAKETVVSAPTGVTREDYLKLIGGIVHYFRRFQQPGGEILDPYAKSEIQYSTPNYALAAAVLIENGAQGDLLDSASRALDSSLSQLAKHRAANQSGDFFILPAMLAYRKLRDRVGPEMRAQWEGYLHDIDPDKAYSDRIGPGQPNVMNWNTSAISGEYLRYQDGFTDLAFVDRYMDAQLPRFTPEGLYRDPALPLVYDAAARFNFLVLLQEGYRGPHRAALETLLRRGAWASLLMQSPSGDFPIGGRSGGHVWNDALQTAMFELSARRAAARGDASEAASSKRAAHLAAQAVMRWVRPSGDIWIVKNHFDPAKRFGYEGYSYHSQYNLLTAGYLAMAWSYADDRIAEGPTPAETGNFLVELPRFRKVFANFGGRYLEIDAGADIEHNGTGLLRIETPKAPGSAGGAPFGGGLATGVAWQSGGKVQALAGLSAATVKSGLALQSRSGGEMRFSIRYEPIGSAVRRVTETYTLYPQKLVVDADVEGPVERIMVRYPAFVTDGRDRSVITTDASGVTVQARGMNRSFKILTPNVPLSRTHAVLRDKSGLYAPFEGSTPGNRISYQLGWN
jgi:hypothetical protein